MKIKFNLLILFLFCSYGFAQIKINVGGDKYFAYGVNAEISYKKKIILPLEIFYGHYLWYNYKNHIFSQRPYTGIRLFFNFTKYIKKYFKNIPDINLLNAISYYISYDYPDGFGQGLYTEINTKKTPISTYLGFINGFSDFYFRLGYSFTEKK